MTWLDIIFEIVDKYDFSLFCEPSSLVNNYIVRSYKDVIVVTNITKLLKSIVLTVRLPTLRTYNLFKSTFQTERYPVIFNQNHRQSLVSVSLLQNADTHFKTLGPHWKYVFTKMYALSQIQSTF